MFVIRYEDAEVSEYEILFKNCTCVGILHTELALGDIYERIQFWTIFIANIYNLLKLEGIYEYLSLTQSSLLQSSKIMRLCESKLQKEHSPRVINILFSSVLFFSERIVDEIDKQKFSSHARKDTPDVCY